MTGTGTQADPYIVDNWPDFCTAIGTVDAYVEFPQGGGNIDFNNYSPTGLSASVPVRCKSIKGNGWTISNIYCLGKDVFYSYTKVYIERLNFLDFYVDFQTERRKFFWHDNDNSNDAEFHQCAFSGVLVSRDDAQETGLFFIAYYYSRVQCEQCSINVQLGNGCKLYYVGGTGVSTYNHLSYCNIKLQGNSAEAIEGDYRNCLFSGSSKAESVNITYNGTANSNIFNVDFTEASAFNCTAPSGSLNLINTDLLPAGATIGTGFVGVTTAQLHDAAYLASIGFPIGVD